MAKQTRMVSYTRDRAAATPDKFAGLRKLVADARASNMSALLVDAPQSLGDTYDELIENLDLIAAADLALVVVPPGHRVKH